MASPPPDVTFQKSDFPDTGLGSQSALDKFFLPLNNMFRALRQALNGGLTFGQNMNGEIKRFDLTTPTSGTGVLNCFPLNLSTKVRQPQGILLFSARDKSTAPGAPSLGQPSWVQNADGTLRVTNIPGLLLGRTYEITLFVVGG